MCQNTKVSIRYDKPNIDKLNCILNQRHFYLMLDPQVEYDKVSRIVNVEHLPRRRSKVHEYASRRMPVISVQ